MIQSSRLRTVLSPDSQTVNMNKRRMECKIRDREKNQLFSSLEDESERSENMSQVTSCVARRSYDSLVTAQRKHSDAMRMLV